jgi:hypothetical protein
MASDDEIKIVLSRLELMPSTMKLVIREGQEALNKDSLIAHVKNEDEIGELIVKAHMLYLRSFKESQRF